MARPAAFVFEQELGDRPALPFFADAVGNRGARVVEKHLVDFVVAGHRQDRCDLDPGLVHRHQQERDSGLLAHRRIGAHQRKDPVGVMVVRSEARSDPLPGSE